MKRAAVIGGTHCIGDSFTLSPIYEEYDILIISFLDNEMLTKSALGLKTDLTDALIKNKPVVILNDALEYKKTNNKGLYKLYEGYAKMLRELGVLFVDSVKTNTNNTKKTCILTAKDIENHLEDTITIDKGTIITPLAHDIAREKNIRIIRTEQIC